MLNDRQIATLLWAGVVLVAVLAWPTGRRCLADVVRAVLSRKAWPVFVVFALLALWSLGLVLVGERVGIWTDDLAADTWFWFFTTAVILLFNFNNASKKPDFFTRTAKEAFGLTLILGFLSDLYVLSVPVEFVGQGVVAILAGVSVVAARQRDSEPARKLVDGCLSLIGLTILVLALYAAYEQAFTWINFRDTHSLRARFRAKAAVAVRLHGQATLVDKLNLHWARRVADASSFRAALAVVDEFREDLDPSAQEEQDAADRLVRYAGIDAVDEEGRRLDRREFEETTQALRWIATCQMGWGRRETGYRSDILDVIGDLTSHGLPGDGGIEVHASPNGGSWYAWRRTISDWVFAIGAAGPPPDEWQYDGPQSPSGFPGESPDWGSGPFDYDAAPNW